MTTNARARTGRFGRLDKWWSPFVWIMLTPIVTLPLSVLLSPSAHDGPELGLPDEPPDAIAGFCPEGDDPFGSCIPNFLSPFYEYYEVTPTVMAFALPGLLNLVPFGWAASGKRRVRAAGIVAGLLGLLRLSIPVAVLMSLNRLTSDDGRSYLQSEATLFSDLRFGVWALGFMAWVGSLVVFGVFRVLTRGSRREIVISSVLAAVGGLLLLLSFLFWPLVIAGAGALYLSYRGLRGKHPGAVSDAG